MAERSEEAPYPIYADIPVLLERVEVVAETAHGVIEIVKAPDTGFFAARHVLHTEGVQWLPVSLLGVRTLHMSATGARRDGLNFYEQWKKEFALEYLAYSLKP